MGRSFSFCCCSYDVIERSSAEAVKLSGIFTEVVNPITNIKNQVSHWKQSSWYFVQVHSDLFVFMLSWWIAAFQLLISAGLLWVIDQSWCVCDVCVHLIHPVHCRSTDEGEFETSAFQSLLREQVYVCVCLSGRREVRVVSVAVVCAPEITLFMRVCTSALGARAALLSSSKVGLFLLCVRVGCVCVHLLLTLNVWMLQAKVCLMFLARRRC